MMQRTANENTAGFGNQRASQDPKMCSDNDQNMRIMLAVCVLKMGEILPVFSNYAKNYASTIYKILHTLYQNGRSHSFLLFTFKLALVASFKRKYSFEF